MALNPDDLKVVSFPTEPLQSVAGPGGGFCCTGCVSGCGYNPTASGCDSASGDIFVCQAGVGIE